jgi:hypothetical protein
MKNYRLNSADFIKGIVIDYMLQFNHDILIGNEIMYGTERRLVDLVLLKKKRITAIEIKSDMDNLKRIHEQIKEYRKIFDYVVLVITQKHLNKIMEVTSNDIGIYLVNEDTSIKIIRPPHLQKEIEKHEILYSINSRYLKKISDSLQKSLSADEIRRLFEGKTLSCLQKIFYNYLEQKISPNYKFFLTERGSITHIEDLGILSSSRNLIE